MSWIVLWLLSMMLCAWGKKLYSLLAPCRLILANIWWACSLQELSWVAIFGIVLLNALGYLIFRASNNQKKPFPTRSQTSMGEAAQDPKNPKRHRTDHFWLVGDLSTHKLLWRLASWVSHSLTYLRWLAGCIACSVLNIDWRAQS